MQPSHAVPASIRDRFLADHLRLEVCLARILSAFETDDREQIAKSWDEFDAGLRAHLDAEEAHLVPLLARRVEADAAMILSEHKELRKRLLELATGIDLHLVRLTAARAFVDELRAHSKKEDAMLYRLADASLSDTDRKALFHDLADAPPPMARIGSRAS